MKFLAAFLALVVALAAAPTTPISNAVVQVNGTAQSGVLAGNGAGVPVATATGSQVSTALDLLGSTAQGAVLYRGASGWSILAPGTSGYVLTAAGAGADPSWTAEGHTGTVTSFSAGDLSPLFTTNVATATTTPALTFALSNASANRVFAGPATGADAAPTFRALVTADLPAGVGDVVGPSSATNNAFARWDTTTGKLLKDTSDLTYSTPTLSVPDAFNVSSAGSISLTAGGSDKNVRIIPSGFGAITDSQNPTVFVASASDSFTPRFVIQTPTSPQSTHTRTSIAAVGYSAATGGFPDYIAFNARGTSSVPTALQSGDVTGYFRTGGFDGTYWTGNAAGFWGQTTENWSTTNRGTEMHVFTIPRGTASLLDSVLIRDFGGMQVARSNGSLNAWGVSGPVFSTSTSKTFTDLNSSGTVATAVASSYSVPTFAASSATTFTNAANLYIAGDVANGTNVTLTNSYGLWNVGKTRLDGAVQLPSTNTAGLQLYNTAIDATNYERLEALWSSNTALLRTVRAGTGVNRSLQFAAGTSGMILRGDPSSAGTLVFDSTTSLSSTASIIGFFFRNFQSSATSGTTVGLSLTPTYNQASGTAANTDLLINRTETAVGSGAQLLIDAQVGSSSRFSVTNSGSVTYSGVMTVSTDTLSGAGAVSVTKDTTKLTSTGVAQAITLANGVDGQIKRIIHDVDGGSMVLTPTTKTGWSTATFTNAGDSLTLEYVTTRGWIVMGSYGTVVAP